MVVPQSAPPAIDAHVEVVELPDGKPFADRIMQRRYRRTAPDTPIHVLAFARTAEGRGAALFYVHFAESVDILLGGGACVDDHELRRLPVEARVAIRQGGGLYRHALAWAFGQYATRYLAIFGYSGDVLAQRSAIEVGFEKTQHRYLLARFLRAVDVPTRQRLIAQAHAIGPF